MHTQEYFDNDVCDKDSVELICLLYAKAIEKLNQAHGHMRQGKIPERSAAIARTMEILAELQGSLNADGGEVAANLDRLYIYVQERLIEANAGQRKEPLEEAIRLLTTLYEGWRKCRDSRRARELSPAPPADRLRSEAAREWTS